MIEPLTETVAAQDAAIDLGSWVQVADIAVALLLTGVIGVEREVRAKSAGLRTHVLVGVGSALFMVISKYGFTDVVGDGVGLDPSRVAAQVVSGIGFIGGGLIFVRRDAVKGLTTAATIWVAAAVGMAAGAGLWVVAAATTVMHLVVVLGVTALARRLPRSRHAESTLALTYEPGGATLARMLQTITGAGFAVARMSLDDVAGGDDGLRRVRIGLTGTAALSDVAVGLESIRGVVRVSVQDANADLE